MRSIHNIHILIKKSIMAISVEVKMTLRLELFVNDLSASLDFYRQVLGFEIGGRQSDGYTLITNGEVHLGLNLLANLPDDHPVQSQGNERLGREIEIVLEVDHIEEIYKHVILQNWPLADKLQRQPWGLTDFRVLDPDGYYIRITTRIRK
jgi:catechol 2,3-dioxygenase-like lactoylglutathione lyase family enzyme